jgi:hypothetical protein
MSYSTIKAIYYGDRTEDIFELRNSHGTAPYVWEAMAKKYLGITKAYDHPNKGWMQLDNELWDLWKRKDVPEEHKLVFMLTFDRAYIARENYQKMSQAIKKFLLDFPPVFENVNHWMTISEILEGKLNGKIKIEDIPGIGLYCTSVSEDPFQGSWNEDKDEYNPPDWSTIWEICEEISTLKV